MNRSIACALLLLGSACSRPQDGGGRGAPPPPFHHLDVDTPQASPSDPAPDPGPLTYPQPCHPLHSGDTVHAFELEIDESDLAALRVFPRDTETWRPAVFKHDGATRNVMVSNRGNGPCGDKLQLAIAFNKIDPEGRYQGLRRITLDHGHCRVLDERLAWAFVREDLGMTAPCASHATLRINGANEGLFTNLETMNKDFLKRSFGPELDDGNLWKEGHDLATNEDTGTRDVLNAFRHAETLREIEEIADLSHAVRYWAVEAVLPATDNFWVDGWNYFLYEHPTRGMIFVPRDYDKAMPWTDAWVSYDPLVTSSAHHPASIVLQDEGWKSEYERAVAEVLGAYDAAVFEARIDEYWEQVRLHAAEDPYLSYSPGSPPPARYANYRRRADWLRTRVPKAD
jgi:hypothetical protein